MSVKIDVTYRGDLHCSAVHGPSGECITTDAPVDNEGRGEHFSPTDLLATALGTCMLTLMGIAARKHKLDIRGACAEVVKEMSNVPRRHIARLGVRITVPGQSDSGTRKILEDAAHACPVCASLGPQTRVDVEFVYV